MSRTGVIVFLDGPAWLDGTALLLSQKNWNRDEQLVPRTPEPSGLAGGHGPALRIVSSLCSTRAFMTER